jgi:hypothetical protein
MNRNSVTPEAMMSAPEPRELTWEEIRSVLALLRNGHPPARISEITGIRKSAVRAVAAALVADRDG